MPLVLQDIPTTIGNSAAAAQAVCPQLTDFSAGSPFLALLYASAYNSSYLQYLITLVLATARLSTSTGTDVDTFVGDFGLTRLQPISATGNVTFTRFSSTYAATIPPGAQVQTSDNTQQFTVTTDTTNAAWSVPLAAYVMAIGITSLVLPVVAVNPGTQGNIAANAIGAGAISSSIPGVDNAFNALAYTNGLDGETDAQLIARFPLFLASLSSATGDAVDYAVASTQRGLTYQVVENGYASAPGAIPGFFSVYVDDGTGAPSGTLLDAIGANIELTRPISVTYQVIAATVVSANISVTITASTGYVKATLQGLVATAIQTFLPTLGVGNPLQYSVLSAVIMGVEGVAYHESLLINSGTADLAVALNDVIYVGTLAVN